MAAELHFSPREIPEPTLMENVLRSGLFFGAVLQLVCVLAITLPVPKRPETDWDGLESKTWETVKKPKASAAQLSKKAKKESKKKRPSRHEMEYGLRGAMGACVTTFLSSPCKLLLPSPASGAMLRFEESFPWQAVKDDAAASFVSLFVIGSVEQGDAQNSSKSAWNSSVRERITTPSPLL
ncbi:uncharacterized protein LOC125686119 isoform X14 [Lagopus muta]|uniref:uncharacterized protein LOC125686119 isoform X10 n=1 Tax=Lagopus muta TaxID=64668 RepID=UPI0020A18515|nr:uncharacterized protein LOC125686119 isoform X10 [Lagopus muta]XP_048785743.1 uncharacterized protein LOC125686119 isoform X10 [Lagopus muta]XP_048785745.1 uncharacterized protein LOC125686119 isoform X12 [Lagopus muta]XP_048785747.1 uncharacterized protein LOC125686119 isoform X14 [Lagopus muta]